MDGRTDGIIWMDVGYRVRQTDGETMTDGWMDGWTDRQLDSDGWIYRDGWIDRHETLHLLYIFYLRYLTSSHPS